MRNANDGRRVIPNPIKGLNIDILVACTAVWLRFIFRAIYRPIRPKKRGRLLITEYVRDCRPPSKKKNKKKDSLNATYFPLNPLTTLKTHKYGVFYVIFERIFPGFSISPSAARKIGFLCSKSKLQPAIKMFPLANVVEVLRSDKGERHKKVQFIPQIS